MPVAAPPKQQTAATQRKPMTVPSSERFQRSIEEGRQQSSISWLGWRKLSGVVIAVSDPYQARSESHWLVTVGKVVLGIVVIPTMLGFAIASQILAWMLPGPKWARRESPGFSNLFGKHVAYSYMSAKLFGTKEGVTVRDVRIRDANGLEHLARLRGELFAGSLSVGDEVELEGYDRHGTLMCRLGRNKRTRSKIIVRTK